MTVIIVNSCDLTTRLAVYCECHVKSSSVRVMVAGKVSNRSITGRGQVREGTPKDHDFKGATPEKLAKAL